MVGIPGETHHFHFPRWWGSLFWGPRPWKHGGWVRVNLFFNSLSTQFSLFINFSAWFLFKLMTNRSVCHRKEWTCSRGQQEVAHPGTHLALPPDLFPGHPWPDSRAAPDHECCEWKLGLQKGLGFLWDGGSSPDSSCLLLTHCQDGPKSWSQPRAGFGVFIPEKHPLKPFPAALDVTLNLGVSDSPSRRG